MEAFNLLKFWRNSGADVSSGVDHVKKSNYGGYQATETDEETDDDESFFELELTSPDEEKNCSITNEKSPIDVLRNGKDIPLDSNSSKPQSPISVLRSTPKFRGFMLGFKKSKPEETECNGELTASSKNGQSKRFSVEEVTPAVTFLSRDNSLRSKLRRESSDEFSSKRFDKDVPKYLKLIKPLYTKASKMYGERMCSPLSSPATERLSSPRKVSLSSPRKISDEKQGNRVTVLKNAYKNLGRSLSELSAVGNTPSPVHRRDDSLLQQHDIQSAILHCKRSYTSSAKEFSVLSSENPFNHHTWNSTSAELMKRRSI